MDPPKITLRPARLSEYGPIGDICGAAYYDAPYTALTAPFRAKLDLFPFPYPPLPLLVSTRHVMILPTSIRY